MGEKSIRRIKEERPYYERAYGEIDVDDSILKPYLNNLRRIMGTDEAEAVIDLFPLKTFKKGTILLRAGEIAKDSYYNFKGLVRQYYLIDGEERNTFFYTEGHSITSMTSYINRAPSKHYLSCIEDTTLSIINFNDEKAGHLHHFKT